VNSGGLPVEYETLFVLVAVLAVLAAWRVLPRVVARVPFVEPDEAAQWLRDGTVELVIDVRSHGDYAGTAGHIRGAINLPYGYIAERLDKVGEEMAPYKDRAILIAGGGDTLAAHSVRLLRKKGFNNLAILRGGMKGWVRGGFPVEYGLPENAEIRME